MSTDNALSEGQKCMREYYIAYFDILGYKDFFINGGHNANLLLCAINQIVSQARQYYTTIQESALCGQFLQFDLQIKSFSDNFLFCIEVSESLNELNRLAFFLSIIADIQRMCLQDFGLLMRGGITRGNLLFTDDVVFGRGIVDVVTIEQEARYPRIVVDASIIDTLKKWHAQVKEIELKYQKRERENLCDRENIEERQRLFWLFEFVNYILRGLQQLICHDADGVDFLNFFYKVNYRNVFSPEMVNTVDSILQQGFPKDYQLLQESNYDYPSMLEKVKGQLIEKLLRFGQYEDLQVQDVSLAEKRESVLKKYLWVMRLYNLACTSNDYCEKVIPAITNVDGRFLRITIQMGVSPENVKDVVKTFTIE